MLEDGGEAFSHLDGLYIIRVIDSEDNEGEVRLTEDWNLGLNIYLGYLRSQVSRAELIDASTSAISTSACSVFAARLLGKGR